MTETHNDDDSSHNENDDDVSIELNDVFEIYHKDDGDLALIWSLATQLKAKIDYHSPQRNG